MERNLSAATRFPGSMSPFPSGRLATWAPASPGTLAKLLTPLPYKALARYIRHRPVVGSDKMMIIEVNRVPVSQLQLARYTVVPVEPARWC